MNNIREINANQFPGYCYEIFDKSNNLIVLSRSYSLREEAIEELFDHLKNGKKDINNGPYTGILWPSKVTVIGEVFK